MGADPPPVAPGEHTASLEVRIRGRVQGVGFRYFTLKVAHRLNLTGCVMNLRDGGVQVYAEGPRDSLEEFLGALQRGPGGARVREMQTFWGTPTGEYSTFSIQPTQ